MRHDTKPRLFKRPYWRYLNEQTQFKLQRKAASNRLRARIQDLPDELQLKILEHWTHANPILVSHSGSFHHPLVYKTAKLLNAKENAAVYRAAPIVLYLWPRPLDDGSDDRANAESWLRALRFATEPSENTKRHFLDFHDKHHGEAARKHIRLHVKVAVSGNCPKRPRIYCDGLGEVTQEPFICQCRSGENQYVSNRIQLFSSQIAENTGVPRENIITEFKFSHPCCILYDCEYFHRSCRLGLVAFATFLTFFLPPATLIGGPLWYCASVLKMAVDPWNEYKKRFERHKDVILPGRCFLYAMDLGLVPLGAFAAGPLVFPLGWTIRRSVAMAKAAGIAHQARKVRRSLCKAAEREFKAAATEKAAAVDRLRKLDPLSAFQLADLDLGNSWSETILTQVTGVCLAQDNCLEDTLPGPSTHS